MKYYFVLTDGLFTYIHWPSRRGWFVTNQRDLLTVFTISKDENRGHIELKELDWIKFGLYDKCLSEEEIRNIANDSIRFNKEFKGR